MLAPPTSTAAPGRACAVEARRGSAAVRIGLGYVIGRQSEEVAALVAARERGRAVPRSSPTSPRAPAPGGDALERLAWAGACATRRSARAPSAIARRGPLWRLGVAAARRAGAGGDAARAAARGARGARAARARRRGSRLIADYAHHRADARRAPAGAAAPGRSPPAPSPARPRADARTSERVGRRAGRRPPAPRHREGHRLPAARGRVRDVNLIVPPPVYERHRLDRPHRSLVRAGRLERRAGVVNVLARASARSSGPTSRSPRSADRALRRREEKEEAAQRPSCGAPGRTFLGGAAHDATSPARTLVRPGPSFSQNEQRNTARDFTFANITGRAFGVTAIDRVADRIDLAIDLMTLGQYGLECRECRPSNGRLRGEQALGSA